VFQIKDSAEVFKDDNAKFHKYFEAEFDFEETKQGSINKGTYNDGTLEKFISRMRTKFTDKRLQFMMGLSAERTTFQEALEQLLSECVPRTLILNCQFTGVCRVVNDFNLVAARFGS
jgi:hypothetical protein